MPPAIRAENLGKDYGRIRALDSLELEVPEGGFFALLGPNGAGKTTAVHILTSLLSPTRGRAQVGGYEVTENPLSVRQNVGLVFQETTLDMNLTAYENLYYAACLYGLPPETRERRIQTILDRFDLEHRKDDTVKGFSGGMKRVLDLARGLLHRPPILFLDEPTIGLDPVNRRRIWEFIDGLRDHQNLTVFLTTHYLNEAEDCDRVVILEQGEVVARGTPDELKSSLDYEILEFESDHDPEIAHRIEQTVGRSPETIDRGYRVLVESARDSLSEATELLDHHIQTVQVRRPSLEDVFVEVTGHRLTEQGDATPIENGTTGGETR